MGLLFLFFLAASFGLLFFIFLAHVYVCLRHGIVVFIFLATRYLAAYGIAVMLLFFLAAMKLLFLFFLAPSCIMGFKIVSGKGKGILFKILYIPNILSLIVALRRIH